MKLESKRMSEEQMQSSKKSVKEFYREQNELIDDLIDPRENREGAAEEEQKNLVKVKKGHIHVLPCRINMCVRGDVR